MTREVAFAALDLAVRVNGDHPFGVAFFGGEPLLEKDLIRAVLDRASHLRRTRKARIRFKITTNGLLLDDAFLDLVARERIHVALSLDGVQDAHDAHRRHPDGRPTFSVVVAALRRLLPVAPYASVLAVVTPRTAPLLADSMAFLIDEKVRYIGLSLDHTAAWTDDDFEVLKAQYGRLTDLYVRWTREGRKFFFGPFESKLASHIRCDEDRKDHCELGVRQISVSPEGFLFPCVQFADEDPSGEWCIGSVSDGIDDSARTRIRSRSDAEKAFCRGCALLARCHNTCGCLNRQATGSINGISPVMCRHEQTQITAADQAGEILYRERNPLFLRKHYNPAWPLFSLLEDLGGAGATALPDP